MYTYYILPRLDYCCPLWDNCTKQQTMILENLQLDALRTICGAVRGTSHDKLYKETNFIPLAKRREIRKLTLLYKMKNDLTPNYLSDLIPEQVSDFSSYNLRNTNSIRTMRCHTETYSRSFLPDTVRLWNNLPEEIRNSPSVDSFKKGLQTTQTFVPLNKNFGTRFCQIIHARLRLGCSDLHAHRFDRYISENQNCSCGYEREDPLHYFLTCPKYDNIRSDKYFYIKGFNLNTILNGNEACDNVMNQNILESVHQYILQTKRFSSF